MVLVRAKARRPDMEIRKILHVEDEGLILMMMRKAFQGVTIDEVSSIRDAVAHIQFVGNNYDCIILDLGLPDSEGVESVRTIHLASASPIVVNTGGDTKDLEVLAEALGVYEICHKATMTSSGMRRAVEGAVAKHQLRRMEGLLRDMKGEREKYRAELLRLKVNG
jgi:HTH-type transcriptional regulator, bacterioopsin transcriptional activator and related proteins